MGKKSRKILEAVEKLLKRQDKMMETVQQQSDLRTTIEELSAKMTSVGAPDSGDVQMEAIQGLQEETRQLRQMIQHLQEDMQLRHGDLTAGLEEATRQSPASIPTASDATQEASLRRLEQIAENMSSHDLALTDLLDSWEELQEAHQEEKAQLRKERDSSLLAELNRAENREQALIHLEMETLEQLFYLRKAAQDDQEWRIQLELIQDHLFTQQQQAELIEISVIDMKVDYDLHEVLEVRDTEDPTKDATVAEVLQPGFLYLGDVIRKAKVAAWKYRTEDTPSEDEEQF